ncbi:MAG: hypothetical protein R3B06_20210 [Kofleriaceae bacterium]
MLRALAVTVAFSLLACGPKGDAAHPPGARSAVVSAYPGLAYVPADATYLLASHRLDGALQVVRDLADAVGPLDGMDATRYGAGLARVLGFDPSTAAGLADQGFDLERGFAVWARGGLGPVIAMPVADAARVMARIDRYRAGGAVVQTTSIDGHDVSTWRAERELAIHWAFVADWLLVHVEFTVEREADGAWLTAALAAGGRIGGAADVAATLAQASQRLGVATPAVIGLLRWPAVRATAAGAETAPCDGTMGQLGSIMIGATGDGATAAGVIVADLPGGVASIRAMALPAPAGWAAARGAAPASAELGLDLRRFQAAWAPCLGDGLTRDALAAGVFGGRAFALAVDLEDGKLQGALAATVAPAAVAQLREQIPGLAFLERTRLVGGVTVHDVRLPMVPAIAYAQTGERLVATAELPIDPLVTGGDAGAAPLARVELYPQAWPAETWDQLFGMVIGRDRLREHMVELFRRWRHGVIEVNLEDRALVLTARGER